MRKLISLTLAGILLTTGTASAQTPKVEQSKPFGVAATHDGLNTDNFTLTVTPVSGGAAVVTASLPVTSLANGDITFSGLTAPARGSYNVVICATNLDGLSACSDPLQFQTTKGQPNKPGKPRIVQGLLAFLEKPIQVLAKVLTGKNPFADQGGPTGLRLIVG